MDKQILEAVNEMCDTDFETLVDAKNSLSTYELLDAWLRYEGISGYTTQIMEVMETL